MPSPRTAAASLLASAFAVAAAWPGAAIAEGTCSKPVYLTIDTGHMGVAPPKSFRPRGRRDQFVHRT